MQQVCEFKKESVVGVGVEWYAVRVGGYESIPYPDGTVNREYVFDRMNVPVPAHYSFGAVMATLRAKVAQQFPGKSMVGSWSIPEPAIEF